MAVIQLSYKLYKALKTPNPSWFLYPVGVRIDGSVWFVKEENFPYVRMERIRKRGNVVNIVPVAVDDQAVQGLIEFSLSEDGNKFLASMCKSIADKGEELLAKGDTKGYEEHLKMARDRFEEHLKAMAKGAATFGFLADWSSLLARADALRANAARRGQEYMAVVQALQERAFQEGGVNLSRAQAIVQAAEADALPAGILLDFAEDMGVDTSVARQVFAAPQNEAPVQGPVLLTPPVGSPHVPVQFPCSVCGKEMGLDRPSGVCSAACLNSRQGFAPPEQPATPPPHALALEGNGQVERRAVYKNRHYRLLYLGSTRYGRRARLGFIGGNNEFWVAASALERIYTVDA